MNIPNHALTVLTLPNGQTIEIDLRDQEWSLSVHNSAGDCVELLAIVDNDDEGNLLDPSLNAAERNSLLINILK